MDMLPKQWDRLKLMLAIQTAKREGFWSLAEALERLLRRL
jgi:hypothetical protein